MKRKTKTKEKKSIKKHKLSNIFHNDENNNKLNRKDKLILSILVIIYLIFSFYNLGTLNSPKTYYQFNYLEEEAGLELVGVNHNVSKIRYYTGPETGNFKLMVSTDGDTYKELTILKQQSVFAWEDLKIDSSFKYIKFISQTQGSYLGEVQFYNKYGEKIVAKATDDQSEVIVDEAKTVPAKISYLNSTYFDEIYFARSAYEYVHGIDTMEWVHPPLGKLIMAIPILLFGMSTFTYRLMGTLAGVLMIPVIYIFAKRIFKNTKWAALAGILMTFDCFHFSQTRMATVDSFLVLFIMLAALFMYQYITLEKSEKFKKKIKNLALSGLFIGFSIATKWTGLYAALALAIVFFADLLYKNKGKKKKIEQAKFMRLTLTFLGVLGIIPIAIYYLTALINSSSLATTFTVIYYGIVLLISIIAMIAYLIKKDKELWKIFLVCLITFIIVPVLIYILSYMLFPTVYNYTNNSLSGIINQIKDMYHYHSTLTEGHSFSSPWYQWPFMIRPVWYYVGMYGGTVKSTIVGIGNPAIWWFGVIAFIYVLTQAITKKNKENLFILVFILCTFLPYCFIGRSMFMYHYFPTLPFIMLAIVALVKWITERIKGNSFYIFYISVVILFFLIFYPVISGMLTTSDYINALKWLETWIF